MDSKTTKSSMVLGGTILLTTAIVGYITFAHAVGQSMKVEDLESSHA